MSSLESEKQKGQERNDASTSRESVFIRARTVLWKSKVKKGHDNLFSGYSLQVHRETSA